MEKTIPPEYFSEYAQKLITGLPAEILQEFIRDMCVRDYKFCRLFVARHLDRLYPLSGELYAAQVNVLAGALRENYSFNDYGGAFHLGFAIEDIIDSAGKDLGGRLPEGTMQAMLKAFAVIEGLSGILDEVDNHDGDLAGCITGAIGLLDKLSHMDLEESLRAEMFRRLVLLCRLEDIKSGLWDQAMLEIADRIARTPWEMKEVLSLQSPACGMKRSSSNR